MVARRWRGMGLLLVLGVVATGAALAQGGAVLRIALVPRWVLDQHRAAAVGSRGALVPAFRSALDAGVVDRVVFWWQRGTIQRQLLVRKPVRVLSGPEAEALGGRGEFRLGAVRPPGGHSAWTEVEVVAQTARPPDVAILEIGGELSTIRQVVQTILVTKPDGVLAELPLAVRALVPGEGVPVVRTPAAGQPVSGEFFPGSGGVALLVVRSPVEVIVDGGVSPNGPADAARHPGNGSGDWREGDRVLFRLPLATLRDGAAALVLGWKDRQLQPDPDGTEFPRRASLAVPLPH